MSGPGLQLRYVVVAFVVTSQVLFMLRAALVPPPRCAAPEYNVDHGFNPLDGDDGADGGGGGDGTDAGGPDHTHDDGGVHVRDRVGGDVYLTVVAIPKPVRLMG